MSIYKALKSKWLWPLWLVLLCIALFRGWQEAMATPCMIVWSPNKQFKMEYYVYGYVPIWYIYVLKTFDGRWPGFIRITDNDGHTIERRNEDGMGLHCDTSGNKKPTEIIGDVFGGGQVIWVGRHKDNKDQWTVYWRNWYNGSENNIDIKTILPAPPLD